MASMTQSPAGLNAAENCTPEEARMLDAQRSSAGFLSFILFPMIAIAAIVFALYEAIG